jgi:hypothetical protein
MDREQARLIHLDEDAFPRAVVGGGDDGTVQPFANCDHRTRTPRVIPRRSLGLDVGNPVLELQKHVLAVIYAEPVAGAQVLVDPHAHRNNATGRAISAAGPFTWGARMPTVNPMRIDAVTLQSAGNPLGLHPRLTVVADLGPTKRLGLLTELHVALAATDPAVMRWTDPLGEARTGPGPRLCCIGPSDVRTDPTTDRVLTLLGRARQSDRDGLHALAVLNDPFADLPIMRIWTLLSLVERVSERIQTLLLTDDEVTVAWATHRASTGALELLRYWGAPNK